MIKDSAIAGISFQYHVCGLCGKPINSRGCRHHVRPRSKHGSDEDENRQERHSACEAVAHILHDHGNPRRRQWKSYEKLVERFRKISNKEPDIRQLNGLAKLLVGSEFRQLKVSDRELIELASR